MFTLRSFTAVTRSGQRAVVIVVADIATVVVDITSNQQYDAIRPRTILLKWGISQWPNITFNISMAGLRLEQQQ